MLEGDVLFMPKPAKESMRTAPHKPTRMTAAGTYKDIEKLEADLWEAI